jgi:acyl-CoA reductase-like NAD-dependent aldehyde dehydrogenase
MRDYARIYIDGAWGKPLDGKIIDVINPATERPAGHITLCTAADVDRAVEAARKALLEKRLIVFPLGRRNTLSLDCVFGYFDI